MSTPFDRLAARQEKLLDRMERRGTLLALSVMGNFVLALLLFLCAIGGHG